MKIKITAAVMAACIIVCAGCSQSKSGNKNSQMPEAMGNMRTQQTVVISDSVKQNATRTVTGTVESIVGNEVTLVITPERAAKGGSGSGMQRRQSEMPDAEKATEMPQRAEFADMAKPTADENKEQQTKSNAQTAETFLLPVGMKMGSKDYSSITAGNTLKIYFGSHPDDGSEMITAVEVLSGRR